MIDRINKQDREIGGALKVVLKTDTVNSLLPPEYFEEVSKHLKEHFSCEIWTVNAGDGTGVNSCQCVPSKLDQFPVL